MQASFVIARNVIPSLSYRVATRLKYLSLLKKRSMRLRFLHSQRLRDDIQESAGYVLGHDDGAVVVLRVSLPLDVPVFDGPDDMGFIGRSELQLDLIAAIGIGVLQ